MQTGEGVSQAEDDDSRGWVADIPEEGGHRQADAETQGGYQVEQAAGPCLGWKFIIDGGREDFLQRIGGFLAVR